MKTLGQRSASLATVVLAALSASQAAPGAPNSELSADSFSVDPNPAICFLELDSHGDLGTFRDSFFGDGRVQFDRFLNSGDSTPDSRWSAQLSESELRSVVSDVIESGLFAFDPGLVLERERKAGKVRPFFTDSGWTEVGVSLLRRPSAGASASEIVARHFELSANLTMSMSRWELPDYPEMVAFRRITALSGDLRRRAQLIPKPRPTFSYAFPQDQRPVVILTSTGVGIPVVTSMTLYESGLAVVMSRGRLLEVQLPMDHLDRVLRDVDEGGLASFDERSLAKERVRLAEGVTAQADAAESWPTLTSSFRLVGAAAPDLAPREISREIVLVGPSSLARRFPAVAAYRALADLEELLFETESFALNSRRDP